MGHRPDQAPEANIERWAGSAPAFEPLGSPYRPVKGLGTNPTTQGRRRRPGLALAAGGA